MLKQKALSYRTLAEELLLWYYKTKRNLPWRGEKDVYKIWVSEIMLQQTQVATVVPYYYKFIKIFPSLENLAQTDTHQLMKVWEGLGYYKRASRMKEVAEDLIKNGKRNLPSTYHELKKLKGIGDYTASIIASICYGEPCVAVDGNVLRVISRVYAIKENIDNLKVKQAIKNFALMHLPKSKPGDYNQALMELGALICKKSNPKCLECPINKICKSLKYNIINHIPKKSIKKKTPLYKISVGVILKGKMVLIALRKPDGLLGNLWNFPGGKWLPGESSDACCLRVIKEETRLDVAIVHKFPIVSHAYTHFKIKMHPFLCKYEKGKASPKTSSKLIWVTIKNLNNYAFPKSHSIVVKHLYNNNLNI